MTDQKKRMTRIYPSIREDQKQQIIQESEDLGIGHGATARLIIDFYFNHNLNK
jgi:hypothetical protein